jgi:hypothetical protein
MLSEALMAGVALCQQLIQLDRLQIKAHFPSNQLVHIQQVINR